MIKRLKGNASLTLVETLIAMLILSTATAGVLGSFSYAFKFIQRAGKKIEAMNYARKTEDAFRAIWLADTAGTDTRLNLSPAPPNDWENAKTPGILDPLLPGTPWFAPNYSGDIYYKITDGGSSLPAGTKLISVKVVWPD